MSTVRDASADDAAQIADVHVASWRAAYRGLLPDEYLDALSVADRIGWWTDQLRAAPGDGAATLVVHDDSGVISGFAVADRYDDTVALLGAMYLRPEVWRRGLGRRLHRDVVDRVRIQGYEQLVLWVHPENVGARRFYEVLGYRDDGIDQVELVWGIEVPERRYRLMLS